MKKLSLVLIIMAVMATFGFAGVAENNTAYSTHGGNYIGAANLVQQIFLAPPTAATNLYMSHSMTNAQLIATLNTGTTTFTLAKGDFTDIIQPRNLYVQMYYSAGIGTTTCNGTLIVNGTDVMGNNTTESISISTTPTAGVNAFIHLNYFTLQITTATMSQGNKVTGALRVGGGTSLGITASRITATTDVKKSIENLALTAPTISTRYNTITPVSPPNSTINFIYYLLMKANPN